MQCEKKWADGRLLVELRPKPGLAAELRPRSALTAELGGKVVGRAPPLYEGIYRVKSSLGGEDRTMETGGRLMAGNVTVEAITVSETSNPAGGTTILIKE